MTTQPQHDAAEPPPGRGTLGAAALALGAGAGAGGALIAVAGGALAPVAVLAAFALALGVPALTAQSRRGRDAGAALVPALRALIPALAALAGLGAAGLLAGVGAGATAWLGALAYLALWAGGLTGWTLALGRAGQPTVTLAALALLALPYGFQPLASGLPAGEALAWLVKTPLPVLAGTFGGQDLLRQGSLYSVLPLGQAAPFGYASPVAALGWLALAAAAGWGASAVRRLAPAWRPGPASAATAALALVLLSPSPAQAQLFPEPSGDPNAIGDLVTRVRLGYYLADVSGTFRVDDDGVQGTRLDFEEDVDLDPVFLLPTFEIALTWENGGRIWIQYLETEWQGEAFADDLWTYDGDFYFPTELVDTRYSYRTIALGGAIDIPIVDYVTLSIVTTQRYIRHETRLRSPRDSESSSLEVLLPGLGAGAEVLIWGPIVAYGDIQWLDIRTDLFGGRDDELTLKYREWRAGFRFMLVEHAHVMVEWYSLQTIVKDGSEERYKQSLDGLRVQVSILF